MKMRLAMIPIVFFILFPTLAFAQQEGLIGVHGLDDDSLNREWGRIELENGDDRYFMLDPVLTRETSRNGVIGQVTTDFIGRPTLELYIVSFSCDTRKMLPFAVRKFHLANNSETNLSLMMIATETNPGTFFGNILDWYCSGTPLNNVEVLQDIDAVKLDVLEP